jgi:hypothetical protein
VLTLFTFTIIAASFTAKTVWEGLPAAEFAYSRQCRKRMSSATGGFLLLLFCSPFTTVVAVGVEEAAGKTP